MSKRGRINLKKLKKNADGLYEFTAYLYKNKFTEMYYCGVSAHPAVRKSLWKGLNNKYAGKKLNDARKKYGIGEDAWEYSSTVVLVSDINQLVATMDDIERALIAKYDSYKNGYNSNAGGLGRGTISRVSVSRPGVGDVIYSSCEEAAKALGMSDGIVYYYTFTSKTHTKKSDGWVFTPIDLPGTTITTMP